MSKHLYSEITADFPRVNIRYHIQNIEQGEKIGSEKKDYGALTALYIKEIWGSTQSWINEHHQSLPKGLNIKECDEDSSKTAIFSTTQDTEFIEDGKLKVTSISEISTAMQSRMKDFFWFKIKDWIKATEEHFAQNTDDSSLEKSRTKDRYDHLLNLLKKHGHKDDMLNHIMSGFNTSIHVIFSIFEVIPHVYKNDCGVYISTDDVRSIARESKKLITILAGMGLYSMPELEKKLGFYGGRNEMYNPEAFYLHKKIVGSETKLQLSIKPEILRKVKEELVREETITGCPALAIDGASGNNIVSEVYEWFYTIADTHYFPAFDILNHMDALAKHD